MWRVWAWRVWVRVSVREIRERSLQWRVSAETYRYLPFCLCSLICWSRRVDLPTPRGPTMPIIRACQGISEYR